MSIRHRKTPLIDAQDLLEGSQNGHAQQCLDRYCCCFTSPRVFALKVQGFLIDIMGCFCFPTPRFVIRDSSLFLLGQEYSPPPVPEDPTQERKQTICHVSEFLAAFRSIIWFVYRKDFPPIGRAAFTSDAGWGCMIRTGQMLLAQAIKQVFLGKGWILEQTLDMSCYQEIISWFHDSPQLSTPYSIHNIIMASREYGMSEGQWFSPSDIGNALQMLVNSHSPGGMRMVMCRDGSIYKDQVQMTASMTGSWAPVFLYLPLRLGLASLNLVYRDQIINIFKWPQCIGMVGGRPRASYYFVGLQDQELLYLDPHVVKSSAGGLPALLPTYICQLPFRMPIEELDPSLALGFLLRSEDEFEDLCVRLTSLVGTPLVTVYAKMPAYVAASLQNYNRLSGTSSLSGSTTSTSDASNEGYTFVKSKS